MTEVLPKIILPLSLVLGALVFVYRVIAVSASGNAYLYLGGLIAFEIFLMAVWDYPKRFLPVLLITFLGAGTSTPLKSAFISGRWGVLAVGAAAGFVLYMKSPSPRFRTFHLVALSAIVAALVSAMASNYPRIALLKTLSLFLMFLYGAAGGRLAVVGREAKFCAALLLSAEILVYFTAFFYFVLHWPIYGNPNSLGIIMGVVAFPLLLWGVIVSEGTGSHKRRVLAFVVCLLLLFSSYARAALGAAFLSSLVLCVTLRRYRLLMKGVGLTVLGAVLMLVVTPLPEAHSNGTWADRLTDAFIYKGKREKGFFGSRESPWKLTTNAIRQHPWFGTGFGTSATSGEAMDQTTDIAVRSNVAAREHGTSYLAIIEWTGLLGVIPFYVLVLLVGVSVCRVVIWMRRTRNPFSPAVPVAMILAGALFHAAFEDWMFAPGYYMCVFFWVFAFVLMDVLPDNNPTVMQVAPVLPQTPNSWDRPYHMIAPGQ